MGTDFLELYQHESQMHDSESQTRDGTEIDDMEYQKEEDEIDLAKTKESLWDLLTGRFQTVNQYESVFQFIEESMPQLKRVQQQNMRVSVEKMIF